MSNAKLKNKTVALSVQEVQCPVSGIYFPRSELTFMHKSLSVIFSATTRTVRVSLKAMCALELPANSLNSLLSGLSRRIRK